MAGKRILLVEDDEMIREATTELLQSLGYEVASKQSGKGAISGTVWKEGWTPDLILAESTAVAPIVEELAKRALESEPDIPLLVIVVPWEHPAEETSRTEGIRRLIYKPFTREELAEALRGIP
jgi:CheY-like chemotaxis protein